MLNGSRAVSYPTIPILLTESDAKLAANLNQSHTGSEIDEPRRNRISAAFEKRDTLALSYIFARFRLGNRTLPSRTLLAPFFDIVHSTQPTPIEVRLYMNKVSKASVAYALVVGGLISSGAAMAGVSVGVNIGVPAPVYVAPAPMYAPPPPPVVYAPPPAPMYAQPAIVIGWHGDRYYDGRRYWDRDDWYRHNGRGHAYGHENHGHHGWH